jgi:hypothetical protein
MSQTAAVEYFDSVNKLATENKSDTPTRLTVVEWLIEQITYDNGYGLRLTSYDGDSDINELLEKAKEMEKQQIIDAPNWDSMSISENGIRKGEQYYNEQFKNK